eukprot:COSAG06_NODE_52_length_28059_cov_48.831378_11_plen_187_part_00
MHPNTKHGAGCQATVYRGELLEQGHTKSVAVKKLAAVRAENAFLGCFCDWFVVEQPAICQNRLWIHPRRRKTEHTYIHAEEKSNTQIERKTFFSFSSSSSSSSSSFCCLLQGSTAAEIKKFQTELMTLTRAAQRCEHVCRVMGAAEHEGQLCVIMKEYVESMDALLLRDGTNTRRKRKGDAPAPFS